MRKNKNDDKKLLSNIRITKKQIAKIVFPVIAVVLIVITLVAAFR